jgi:hypothetical protein
VLVIEVERDDEIFVLRMTDGENRFSPAIAALTGGDAGPSR